MDQEPIIKEAETEIDKIKNAVDLLKKRNPPQKILVYPDKKLQEIAGEFDFEKTSKDDIMDMLHKLAATLGAQGYGAHCLAATQIGIRERIMTVGGLLMINPKWTPCKQQKETVVEGCYCTPQRAWKTTCAKYGWAKWQGINGEFIEKKLNGIMAISYQQTLNHLNGICVADIGEEMDVKTGKPIKIIK